MVKEYIRPDGYRIRASEKAYNMLYKKNGFAPVETAAPIEEAAKASKGKGKAAASKSKKADADKSKQEEIPKDEADRNPIDQDAAEQPEGE